MKNFFISRNANTNFDYISVASTAQADIRIFIVAKYLCSYSAMYVPGHGAHQGLTFLQVTDGSHDYIKIVLRFIALLDQ